MCACVCVCVLRLVCEGGGACVRAGGVSIWNLKRMKLNITPLISYPGSHLQCCYVVYADFVLDVLNVMLRIFISF